MAVNGWAMNKVLVKDHPVLEWPGDGNPGGPADDSPVSTTPDAETGLSELAANLDRMARKAERTDAADWHRSATLRGAPDEEVAAPWFPYHVVHEGSHHLRGVHQVLRAVRSGAGRG